ncbi:gamma-glutamylcyclotransferase [Rubritalea spongiae]|uniref:Gamma-glutamylcyclotransferase n=1 Tax=Rubritalea spongiae TaxID=430797 RepID=A0ABW5DYW9_9BACT
MAKFERVFVYGSLRKGASNAHRMAKANFLCKAMVAGELYQVSWYPGLVLNGASPVIGEVYEVPRKLMDDLDAYEGSEYRRLRRMVTDSGGAQHEVWIYEFIADAKNLQKIPSGDWMEVEKGL